MFRKKITHSILMAFGAFALALAAREAASARTRVLLYGLAGLAAFNVLFMVWGRTGQLVLFTLALYFALASWRWRGLLAAAVAGLAVGAAAYLAPSSSLHLRTQTTIKEFQDWHSGKPATLANMRLEAWTNSVRIVREHPVAGVGTGGFAVAYARLIESTGMAPIDQPENQYLFTTAQLGLVGLAGLLALFATHWRLAARLGERSKVELARGLLIAIGVGCLFNSFLSDHTEAHLFAWLAGLLFAGLTKSKTRDADVAPR